MLTFGLAAAAVVVQAAPSLHNLRSSASYVVSDPWDSPLAQCQYDIVALQADTGNFVSRCQGCAQGDAYPDTGTIHVTDYHNAPFAKWIVHILPNNKVALQCSDTLRFLARCEQCHKYALAPDSAFVHVENVNNQPWAQWNVVNMGGGKVALQADSGKYLARCRGCVSGGATPDFVFVQETSPASPWAQFTVVCAST